ncbi:UNVERIFIED_CONTAM: hypothetical protein Sangu_2812000 [Sesamum angustifolium]|uniref:DUF4218 domain-containing protein n=1 Tax=Sesamum angustifolium TaxID=2727405 RepID=A0AAW2ITQ7_9LAMI
MPKAICTLSKERKRRVCKWICDLKFPDGYASNLACCADMMQLQMHGMNSHDCYVFMQNLIPIAFHEILPQHVWSVLTEVSLLFQIICSTMMDVHKLRELENNVVIILCNLEKIFLPVFFDSMEDLIVLMLYEARVGANTIQVDVPIERFLGELKKKVRKKHTSKHPLSRHTLLKKSAHLCYSILSRTCNPNEAYLIEIMSSRAAMTESRCLFSTTMAELAVP